MVEDEEVFEPIGSPLVHAIAFILAGLVPLLEHPAG